MGRKRKKGSQEVYRAPSREIAHPALDRLEVKWNERARTAVKSWRDVSAP